MDDYWQYTVESVERFLTLYKFNLNLDRRKTCTVLFVVPSKFLLWLKNYIYLMFTPAEKKCPRLVESDHIPPVWRKVITFHPTGEFP